MDTTPNLLRRFAAIVYDTLLVAALLVVASGVITIPVGIGLGEEAAAALSTNPLFRLWLALVPFGFFCWFWSKGGQTLGMRTWRIKVVRRDGTALDVRHALLRAICAMISWLPLGLGFLWSLVDPERLTWHDRLSDTQLILIPKGD